MNNTTTTNITFDKALHSEAFACTKGALRIVVGVDEQSGIICRSLARMPHMLVCGGVGSGKSVMLRGVIASLVETNPPEELRIAVADPKMAEFAWMQGSSHMATNGYITTAEQFEHWLGMLVEEMDRRFGLFSQAGVFDISMYNEACPENKMPYIVTVVDELADLYTSKNRKNVQNFLVRISQKARAAGIHLVVGTAKFGADVLPPVFIANVSCRAVFRVPSAGDSIRVAGVAGAENLRGMGDMLFVDPANVAPIRLHALYPSNAK